MMKGFVKKGLVLLALGVLIAGCAGPASEDSSAAPSNKGSDAGIPMTLDPTNHVLTIGDGSGGFTYSATGFVSDSHTVEVLNGVTACVDDGAGNSKCSIQLWNRDSDEYMANAFIVFKTCASCSGGNRIMDNFDIGNVNVGDGSTTLFWSADGTPQLLDAYTAHPPTNPFTNANEGAAANIKGSVGGAGVAYVTDTMANTALNGNPFGAPFMDLSTTTNVKPVWMISPKCGMVSQDWDFGGTDATLFPFTALVKAQWFPMNPTGADGIPGTGDDDSRFNFMYYDTAYLTITDLEAPATDTAWRKWYRPGSVYRSNVLAGYKPDFARGTAGNAVADITVTEGASRYFSVNLGVESADRLELQTWGRKTSPSVEYYTWISYMISWNPDVLELAGAEQTGDPTVTLEAQFDDGSDPAFPYYFQPQGQSQCMNQANCKNFANARAGDLQIQTALSVYGNGASGNGGAMDRGGYIGVTTRNQVESVGAFWSYFAPSATYQYYNFATELATTVTVNAVGATPSGTHLIPKSMFFRGFAKIRCGNAITCVQQDLADAEPEMWLWNSVLRVRDGMAGRGSEIKLESFQGVTYIPFMKNGPGFGGNTWDSRATFTGAVTNAGPNSTLIPNIDFTIMNGTVKTATTISAVGQYPNPLIRHRGPAVPAWGSGLTDNGTYQGWNVAVCIH